MGTTSSLSITVDRHLGHFHFLARVYSAAINTGCMYPFGLYFVPDISPGVELQGHMVALFLDF